jgi:hypothetical protein
MARLGAPDQGADQDPDSVVRPSQEEINLTFLPYLTFQLELKILYLFPFHHRLVHRACFVTAVSTIGLIATIHLSVLKQILK